MKIVIFRHFLFVCSCAESLLFLSGLSLVAASKGYSGSRCSDFIAAASLVRARVLGHTGSGAVVHGRSCSCVCGIFPDWESNPCRLHWQADSIHCATREVPLDIVKRLKYVSFAPLHSRIVEELK